MLEIRTLGPADLDAFQEHQERHRAESGAGGDPIFTPVSDSGESEGSRLMRETGWAKPTTAPGWIRSWGAFDGKSMVADAELHGGGLAASAHRGLLGIGVQAPYRGRGLGRRLLETVIGWARQQGLAWIDLGVFEGNRPAIELYADLGFVVIGSFEDAFRVRGRSITDIRMVLDLRG